MKIFAIKNRPDDKHQDGLVEGIIDLNGIMVVAAHEVFVVQTGAGTQDDREGEGDVVLIGDW